MIKKASIFIFFALSLLITNAQDKGRDSIPSLSDSDLLLDSTMNYDELWDELDLFLDSLLAPRNYLLINVAAQNGYFNYIDKAKIVSKTKMVVSPGIGYYTKSGFGITATGNVIKDSQQINLYQFAISPSFDYIKQRKIAAGISFTRYFTKDSLSFYTSPLQNEFYAYFLWRKVWLQPGITATYGWGSKIEYKKSEYLYRRLIAAAIRKRLRNSSLDALSLLAKIRQDSITILTKNENSVIDFTVSTSLRHDFYWLDIFSHKDHIRLTPMVIFTAGTQKFGYNQTSTYSGVTRSDLAYNRTNKNVSLKQEFQLLSSSLYLRGEYAIGKLFIQPQLIFDYYFPSDEDNFTTMFSVNIGLML